MAGSDLKRRYSGIQALACAERMPLEERGLREARPGEGLPLLHPAACRGALRVLPAHVRRVVQGSNRSLFGYHFYSDQVNCAATEQARDTVLPRASGKVGLEGVGTSSSFLVYTPVYHDGAPQETADEHRQAL